MHRFIGGCRRGPFRATRALASQLLNAQSTLYRFRLKFSVRTRSGREGCASRSSHRPDTNGEGTMGPYYADADPEDGILMYRDVAGSIEVFEDSAHSSPIGMARCVGQDAAGSAVWRLVVSDHEIEGPWLIVDGEFLSTRPDWRDLYRFDSYHDLSRPRKRGRARIGVQPLYS
jgi:hypothetical protein